MSSHPWTRGHRDPPDSASRTLKAVVDRCAAAMLLMLVAPVFVLLAIAVRADGGPALLRQQRVGAGGRTFTVYKFRSAVADARLAGHRARNGVEGAPLFEIRDDPCITRVGAFLRKYSLDELPQLLNVLNGTMSLVGPRPLLPSELANCEDAARRWLPVRPGITGLWQVSGRSAPSWEESIRLDMRYVENWSMALDLTILWKTVRAVIAGRDAL